MGNLERVSVLLIEKSTVNLTPREVEVARFLAYGASNKQIAQKLDVSDFTVRAALAPILAQAFMPLRFERRPSQSEPTPPAADRSAPGYRSAANGGAK